MQEELQEAGRTSSKWPKTSRKIPHKKDMLFLLDRIGYFSAVCFGNTDSWALEVWTSVVFIQIQNQIETHLFRDVISLGIFGESPKGLCNELLYRQVLKALKMKRLMAQWEAFVDQPLVFDGMSEKNNSKILLNVAF